VSGRSDGTFPLASGSNFGDVERLTAFWTRPAAARWRPVAVQVAAPHTHDHNNINLGGTAWMKLIAQYHEQRPVGVLPVHRHYGGTLIVANMGARCKRVTPSPCSAEAGCRLFIRNGHLAGYYTWNTAISVRTVQFTVTAVLPPPSITNVDFSGIEHGIITLIMVNGAPNGPVNVLTTTNLALPLSGWTTNTTQHLWRRWQSQPANHVDPTLPQSFFMLQAF